MNYSVDLKKKIEEVEDKTRELEGVNKSLRDLNKIGIALSLEHDYERLLDLILLKSRELTNCDAGSLYLYEDTKEDKGNLIFKLVQNDSLSDLPFHSHTLPITRTSISGYVALTGKIVNIEDVYDIPDTEDYTFNKDYDKKFNYRTKSMLVIPMKDHKGKIIGVLQLINKKKSENIKLDSKAIVDTEVISFDERSIDLANSLTSQAAVSIENSSLYQSIRMLFDGFVRASVHAIEQRDPTTSGHSERVAAMMVGMAELINKTKEGKYKDIHFTEEQITELKYAALLHDFGKVGVRENVLVKEKKLFPFDLEVIRNRFDFIKRSVECKYYKNKIDLKCDVNSDNYEKEFNKIDEKQERELKKIDNYFKMILKANEPAYLEEGVRKEIMKAASEKYTDYDGKEHHYLPQKELNFLCIKKGTLGEGERREIESHVTYSYEYLRKIPWTKELKRIPDIVYAHHEVLSGTGYPLRLNEGNIPLLSKIMAIADMYDALTARDRPYKKAVAYEKALNIISSEVKDYRLDTDLFDLFVKGKVYRLVEEYTAMDEHN